MKEDVESLNAKPLRQIVICGDGLAGWMSAAALAAALPKDYTITVLEIPGSDKADIFYGNTAPPEIYNFNLAANIQEPDVFLGSNAAFSLGIHYVNWGQTSRSWVQCFHLPFPLWEGIPFTDFIAQDQNANLQPYLISAQAALGKVFAHPPQDTRNPLSRAEYGYQFSSQYMTQLYKRAALNQRVKAIKVPTFAPLLDGKTVKGLNRPNGQIITADLFIDCTGPEAKVVSNALQNNGDKRALKALSSVVPFNQPGTAATKIRSANYGWQSETILRGNKYRMTVCDPKSENEAVKAHGFPDFSTCDFTLGRQSNPWSGNCVALGLSASVLEPFTSAPFKLLLRDIERLLRLIPVNENMEIEATEYNRIFAEDYQHAKIFNDTHFKLTDLPDTPYWTAASYAANDEKLKLKLLQFESRGHFLTYDLEPFNEQDWAILHFGMGRRPNRTNPFADLTDKTMIETRLKDLRSAINYTLKKMPPHDMYLERFVSYLKKKTGRQ